MKHSDVFYTCEKTAKDKKSITLSFIPQKNAKAVKNDYNLDIFQIDGFRYSEGRSGWLLYQGENFDDYLNARFAAPEEEKRFLSRLNDIIINIGLSPRYTQPKVMKKDVFPEDGKAAD